jgi:pectin methylesterase-like acyl-CoA thioesterase
MRRATTVALLASGLALAGCSSAPDNGKPAKPTPAVTSSAPTKSHAEQLAACTDAIAAGKDEGDGAPECAPLSADDYLKALQGANERGRDAFQSAIASASAAAR